MTPRQLYISDKKEARRVAEAAGTTWENFIQISMYRGSVSRRLARLLASNSNGKMTEMEIMFPADYEPKKSKRGGKND